MERRPPDPTGVPEPTFTERYARWQGCKASAEIQSWIEAPPAVQLNMSANCSACPLHNFVDTSGVCQPCPTGSVSRGDHCLNCAGSGASASDETCQAI